MDINEKLQQAATVADALAVSKRSKPETNYDALILALVLALTGNDQKKVDEVTALAEDIAATLSADDVERAKRESLQICVDADVDDARRAAVLRGHGYFATDDSEWN